MASRKHADLIKLWADNKDATVWSKDGHRGWTDVLHPAWHDDVEYRVILPEYAEAWHAYRDGELQIGGFGTWKDYEGFPPVFKNPASYYRRRPKIETRRLTTVPEGIFDGWIKYDEDECEKAFYDADNVCALLLISRDHYEDIIVGRWAGDGWMSQETPGEWSGPVRGVKFYKVV